MILTIKSATLEAGDYGDYIKAIGVDGNGKEVTKNIGEKFKDKWDLLQENATVNIKMVQRQNKWYVDGIEPIEIEVDETKITGQQKTVLRIEPPKLPKSATRYDNIDKRCALIQATELVKDGKIGLTDWKRWAEEFDNWLNGIT